MAMTIVQEGNAFADSDGLCIAGGTIGFCSSVTASTVFTFSAPVSVVGVVYDVDGGQPSTIRSTSTASVTLPPGTDRGYLAIEPPLSVPSSTSVTFEFPTSITAVSRTQLFSVAVVAG
eukprot:TRINITY_DN454_c0_g1_i1.p1 TRINITY_DN454_c0_g1~~TRINITY_DN454_c0_g1_i1.p1  ORF type:complete len:118 (+),score=14.04 TRINITY_DN454_c0_g1_i1:924-1277(+)